MSKIKKVCIMISFVFVLAGCAYREAATELQNGHKEIPHQNTISLKVAEWIEWNRIAGCFGRSAEDLIEEFSVFEYTWDNDNVERFFYEPAGSWLMFSGEVWQDESYCVAVSFPTRLTKEAGWLSVEELLDEGFVLVKEKEESLSYYRYLFDQFEVKVFAEADGLSLLPMNIMIQDTSQKVSADDIGDMIIPSEILLDNEWNEILSLTSLLGKNEKEIAKQFGSVDKIEGAYAFYLPLFNGNGKGYLNLEGNLTLLEITFSTAFPNIMELLGPQDVKNYFKVPFTASCYDEFLYVFEFEDYFIYISADRDGRISLDSPIRLKINDR